MKAPFSQGDGASFESTQWSLVLAAGENDSPERGAALEALCERYWYPLYAFVRRSGYDVQEAQDLTQEFLTRLLEKNSIAQANPERGRFRSFLLASLRNFLTDEWHKSRAQKRGGTAIVHRIHVSSGESRYTREPADSRTPERLFERAWITALLASVLEQLEKECGSAGNEKQFKALSPFIAMEQGAPSYREVAQTLGMSEGATRIAAHRLRKRYAELFRQEIAHTVNSPEEMEEEVSYLLQCLESQKLFSG